MTSHLPPLGGGGAHTQASLPSLPIHLQSDTHITAHLASRYHVSHPTARLSSHALVSINTYTSSSRGIDGGKEGSALAGAEDMANRAFLRLGHRSENQAVLLLYVAAFQTGRKVGPIADLIPLQWRIRVWQDHHSFAPSHVLPQQVVDPSIEQGVSCCLRVRRAHDHQDGHDGHGIQGRAFLGAPV